MTVQQKKDFLPKKQISEENFEFETKKLIPNNYHIAYLILPIMWGSETK